MDGSDLMLEKFRRATSSEDDTNRVVGVQYPLTGLLTIEELSDHVFENYLCSLSNDSRGYIIVNQSFSGHVGFNLARRELPGRLLGQVFVNSFASTPLSGPLRSVALSVPASAFVRQPPPWMVGRMFLGAGGQGMDTVQAAGGQVDPAVMHHRLGQCLKEEAWDVWTNEDLLPDDNTLYIRGTADQIVGEDIAEKMRRTRPGIKWVHVSDGPHLVIQRFGAECGVFVERFCRQLVHVHANR